VGGLEAGLLARWLSMVLMEAVNTIVIIPFRGTFVILVQFIVVHDIVIGFGVGAG